MTRPDDGTGLVEFALVAVLFFSLLFGIINMGILLAFKQNMTQAASESARAAIAVVDSAATPTIDERRAVALASLAGSVTEFNRACGSTADCQVKIHDCAASTSNFAAISDAPIGSDPADPCLTTYVQFDNTGSDRILPPFPFISQLEPDTLESQTTVRLVPVPTL